MSMNFAKKWGIRSHEIHLPVITVNERTSINQKREIFSSNHWGNLKTHHFFTFGLIHMLFFSSVFSLPVGLINAEETVSVKEFFFWQKLKVSSLLKTLGFKTGFQRISLNSIFIILCIPNSGTEELLGRNTQHVQLYQWWAVLQAQEVFGWYVQKNGDVVLHKRCPEWM